MIKKSICYGCGKEGGHITSKITIETNSGETTEKCHLKCKELTKTKLLKRRKIDYNVTLADIESEYKLIENVFVNHECYDEEKTYTSWELLNKEKVILKFKEKFQKLLSELNDRPYDPNASLLIDKLTTYILNLGQEREEIGFCSPHDVLSDSKEVVFVCNGSEWYESPMIDIFSYMRKYGYPPQYGNCSTYITSLCKAMKKVPDENKEEWEKLRNWNGYEVDYDGGIVMKEYQNAMIGIFDQVRILLISPNYERKARVIYKLHRQYQFSPTYLSRTLLPVFNINIPVNEIMNISSFQELKVNGDPEWLKSLAVTT